MIEITHTSSGRSIEIRQLNTAAASSMKHHAQNRFENEREENLMNTEKRRKQWNRKQKNTNFLTSFVFIFMHSQDEMHNVCQINIAVHKKSGKIKFRFETFMFE